jgi:predicted fused transcriptional regulator/phosphomethylpyrimidine kinase
MTNYFRINQTVIGHCYFKVSEHTGHSILWVIKNKFRPDIRMLLNKFYLITVAEQEQYEKIQEMESKIPDY